MADIKIIEKNVSPIVLQATALSITDSATMSKAVVLLSNCNKYMDSVTEEREKITKPLNEALKAERNRWKPIESNLDEAISTIRGKMSAYQTEQVRIQKEAEIKIAQRIGEGKGKLKIETAIKKIDTIAVPEKEVATGAGLVQFRETQSLKITDESLIPREYLIVDESKLLKALKLGSPILGAEIEILQTPCNFR